SPLPTKLPIPATLHDFGTVGRLTPLPICSVMSMFQIWLAPLASRQSRSLMPSLLKSPMPAIDHEVGTVGRLDPAMICSLWFSTQTRLAPLASCQKMSRVFGVTGVSSQPIVCIKVRSTDESPFICPGLLMSRNASGPVGSTLLGPLDHQSPKSPLRSKPLA